MSEQDALTPEERLLRLALRIAAPIFAVETLAYLLPALFGSARPDWIQLPFVDNSIVKAGLLGTVCWIAGADVRRFSPVVSIVIAGTGIWVAGSAAMLIWADTSPHYTLLGVDLSITAILWLGIALEGSLTVLFAWLHRRALRARWGLRYFSPAQFGTLAALAEVLVIGEDELLTPQEIGQNVDRYMHGFDAQRKWVFKLALTGLFLYPLLSFHPPFTLMAPDDRLDFVRKRFLRDIAERRVLAPLLRYVQAMIRLAQQAAYLGYYGDPRTFESVGYKPFSARPRYAEAIKKVNPDRPRVVTRAAGALAVDGEIEADAVVIGSGAGGATIAYRLAEAGRQVMILERGKHVDPSSFIEDEVEMISRLYEDGALQLSRDFRFQVLQGMCVGGSTVVNNAVCFELPAHVLEHWNEDLGAGLDPAGIAEAFATLRGRLDIRRQPTEFLNPGARKFVEGVEALGLSNGGSGFGIVEANIADCIGCGYCNIGCAFGKKLSMLDTVLPEGQERFGPDWLQVVPECKAVGIETDGRRATAVHCRLPGGRKVRVRANTIVVSAGAVGSSFLLMQSKLALSTAGRNLCFNMGSPMTADFKEELHSYDGLQISHFFEESPQRGFVLETWFNPVVAQALTMPGWLSDHYRNMHRYAHLTATGVLVGTDRNASVRKALTGGPDIVYKPTKDDLAKLIDGLILAGRIYLAAGATRVMPTTFSYLEFSDEAELERLGELIRDDADISLGTGHPQGGNAIARDPGQGVVDPDFRVHGMENLHVCDASVFPSSTTVNPQMTVMALAEYAAPRII